MPRTTPLLSCKAPVVKPGEIRLPVLTAMGKWDELVATPETWRAIVTAVAPTLGQGLCAIAVLPAGVTTVRPTFGSFTPTRNPGGRVR